MSENNSAILPAIEPPLEVPACVRSRDNEARFLRVVELHLDGNRNASEIAADAGIGVDTLRKWTATKEFKKLCQAEGERLATIRRLLHAQIGVTAAEKIRRAVEAMPGTPDDLKTLNDVTRTVTPYKGVDEGRDGKADPATELLKECLALGFAAIAREKAIKEADATVVTKAGETT